MANNKLRLLFLFSCIRDFASISLSGLYITCAADSRLLSPRPSGRWQCMHEQALVILHSDLAPLTYSMYNYRYCG